MTFECSQCGCTKDISLFYNEPSKRGHTRKCKECLKAERQDYYIHNKDRIAEWRTAHKREHAIYERARRAINKQSAREINKSQYLRDAEARKKMASDYRAKHPNREKAHNILRGHVRGGRIVRPPSCQSCGDNGRLQAHHYDYSEPCDVFWLCASCHGLLHKGIA